MKPQPDKSTQSVSRTIKFKRLLKEIDEKYADTMQRLADGFNDLEGGAKSSYQEESRELEGTVGDGF